MAKEITEKKSIKKEKPKSPEPITEEPSSEEPSKQETPADNSFTAESVLSIVDALMEKLAVVKLREEDFLIQDKGDDLFKKLKKLTEIIDKMGKVQDLKHPRVGKKGRRLFDPYKTD